MKKIRIEVKCVIAMYTKDPAILPLQLAVLNIMYKTEAQIVCYGILYLNPSSHQ